MRTFSQIFIKSQEKRPRLRERGLFFFSCMPRRRTHTKLGAGTAFESVASHYERDELPHTLPCHKIVSPIVDFPTSTAYDFYKRNVLVFHISHPAVFLPHHHFTLLLSIFVVACIILAARKAHRRFIKGMLI